MPSLLHLLPLCSILYRNKFMEDFLLHIYTSARTCLSIINFPMESCLHIIAFILRKQLHFTTVLNIYKYASNIKCLRNCNNQKYYILCKGPPSTSFFIQPFQLFRNKCMLSSSFTSILLNTYLMLNEKLHFSNSRTYSNNDKFIKKSYALEPLRTSFPSL